jgi:predicted ATPase/serine/threonine protein kinase
VAEIRATIGRYRLEDVLGRGGMGIVYRARQPSLDRPVALKVIAPDLAADPEYRARFRREARLAAAIDHPHVIPIYEIGEAAGVLFIAMQIVDGVDLHRLIGRSGGLGLDRATRLVCQIAWALDAAHARGLVHRDVKPHNVLVTGPEGREHAYLTDFGLARQGGASTASTPGRLVGTLPYLAPEQLRGAAADARSDIYALGCVLYESLTGRAAYVLPDEGAAIAAKLAEPPPSVREVVGATPAAIDAVVARALDRQPERRFTSAGDFSSALVAASGAASRPASSSLAPRRRSRHPFARAERAPAADLHAGRQRLRSVPVPPTQLIGRQRELNELAALLRSDEVRLLTLTGPGGTGKTRLAVELAASMSTDFEHGTCAVSLAPLESAASLAAAIAQALGVIPVGSEPPLDALERSLRARELLLLLDNFEHLLAATSVVSDLAARCPLLRVLTTSRAPLRISGEIVYPVAPLALPVAGAKTPAELERWAAIALFVTRARAAVPTFELDRTNAPQVAQICRRLGGLPLAIELAAARTTILSPAELLARLSRSLELLTRGSRDLPARQRTLRATIDWSYRLLAPREQELFARLSVFNGGCTVAAAEAVCGASVDELAALVDMSLLHRWRARSGEPRLVMLDTVHEYAGERLVASGLSPALARTHAAYWLDVAERAAPQLQGGDAVAWLDRLDDDHDNLIAAVRWCRESGEPELGLRLGVALAPFWRVRGHAREGRRWLSELLDGAEHLPIDLRACGRYEAGWLAVNQGDYERGVGELDKALELFRASDDHVGRARCLAELSFAHAELGRTARMGQLAAEALQLARSTGDERTIATALDAAARATPDRRAATALAEEALELYRRLGDKYWTGALLNNLGYLALLDGDPNVAFARLEEAADLAEELRDEPGLATARANIGLAALLKDDPVRAAHALTAALGVFDDLGYRAQVAECLLGIAAVCARRHSVREAARIAGAADRLRVSTTSAAEHLVQERYLRPARAELGEADWAAAWHEGTTMAPDDARRLAAEAPWRTPAGERLEPTAADTAGPPPA